MSEPTNPIRYSVITEKNPREIVMLRGRGCEWKRCRFCDYHLDHCRDDNANFRLNEEPLSRVSGLCHRLEVINSGSFTDLDDATIRRIEEICLQKAIDQVHFECHWMHRGAVSAFRERFARKGIALKLKIGVETFDSIFRESYLVKGIDTDDPGEIASYFDEVCLLQGLPGQTVSSMERDITTGLHYFERVCINIMQKNRMPILPDPRVISDFIREVYPKYIGNGRVDILMENTDFGVGGAFCHAE